MSSPPDPPEPGHNHPAPEVDGESLALEMERDDLERQLVKLRSKERWHFLWAVVGISPAAAIPAVGLLLEGSLGWLVVLGFLVTLTQGLGWVKASREAEALERRLESLTTRD